MTRKFGVDGHREIADGDGFPCDGCKARLAETHRNFGMAQYVFHLAWLHPDVYGDRDQARALKQAMIKHHDFNRVLPMYGDAVTGCRVRFAAARVPAV